MVTDGQADRSSASHRGTGPSLAKPAGACMRTCQLSELLRSVTGTQPCAGTFAYASPEAIMGEKCTLASDIYSFGIVLLEVPPLSNL